MIDTEKLAGQFVAASIDAVERCQDMRANGAHEDHALAATFLSGASQVLDYLIRLDGLATPHMVQRAMADAAKAIGLTLAPAKPQPPGSTEPWEKL